MIQIQSRKYPAFRRTSTSTGISTSCRMMPGMAPRKAPERNAVQPKGLPFIPSKKVIATPQTARPASIAPTRDRYTPPFFWDSSLYRSPETSP
ncbi:hypothetical protein EVA_08643 [gut metagenome]|uniref:Uncharacterized protein n=1 Tax=gut metagenome TaxID=749906 RepID=J9G7N0_9ZZZZ